MINVENLKPFPKFCYTIGMIPTSYKESLTYEEQLMWFCDFLQNTVIPTVNNNGQAVQELQNLYIELKSYVDNYFENLDVQTEINNKLDEMAKNGTLQEIITAYLQIAGVLAFNTVQEMKESTNLINGSYAQTLGYHSVNDGGGATYLIREKQVTDIDDEGTIHFINDTLVAEMIMKDYVTPEIFGAYGDNVHDDTIAVQKAVSSNIKHVVLSKKYNISTPISVPSKKIIDGGGEIHSTTTGFKLDGVRYITIKDIRIFAGTNAVYIVSDTSYCSYINLENLYCDGNVNTQIPVGEKAIYINTTNYFINECYYKNCVMYNYQYGIYATAETTNIQMQRHIFTECSPEGSTMAGVYVKNGERFTFENCRCLEGNSSKWVTEGTCVAFNIISGEAWFSPYTNANFSENTNGLIIGALRNSNVAINAPGRNGYIVNGKVIPYKENINPYFKDINSTGLSINYGDELITQFKKNTSQNVTLELTSDYYGGICKINEFYVRMFASGGELTVKVGDYFTKVLNSPATGHKYYRFTYNTLEAEKSWFVEELNLI